MTSLISENPTSDATSHRRVLEVAELVRIIGGFLRKEDFTKLLYVSRRTYTCALPVVWEDVDIGLALRLIPGVEIKKVNEDAPGSPYTFNFPSTLDLSRFNAHSTLIKTIRAHRPYSIKLPSDWSNSGGEAPSNLPFPKLQRIVVHSSGSVEAEHINWVSELLHPDLLGVEVLGTSAGECGTNPGDEHPWLDQAVCFSLLDQIARACPNVQRLSLFPAKIAQSDKTDCLPAYEKLTSLHQLRSLAFSGTIVHEELLQALGRLSHLRTLTLCSDWAETWEYDESSLDLADDSFPVLERLCLHGLDESTMARICKAAPLYRHLVSATLIFEDQSFDENMSDDTRSKLAVTNLGQNSLPLKDLTIQPRGNNGYFVASWPVIEVFKQMNLQSLDLGEVDLDAGEEKEEDEEEDKEDEDGEPKEKDNRDRPPPVGWSDFLAVTPHLEELRMERQEIRPSDLRLLASALPHLRLLAIATVPLGSAESEDSGTITSRKMVLSSWSYFKSQKERAEDEVPDPNSALNAAKYLNGIWPNLTCETHGLKWDYGDAVPHEKALAKLNEALEILKLDDN